MTGEAATKRLRESGQYDSLGAALKAARYAVEKIDPAGLHSRGADYFAANPAQRWRVWFGASGLEVAGASSSPARDSPPWSLTVALRSMGRAGAMTEIRLNQTAAVGNRVEMTDSAAGVAQWFENRPEGVEQGFTLLGSPAGRGSLEVELGVAGDLHPESDGKGEGVRLVDAGGRDVLSYAKLKATDAAGRTLPARIEVRGPRVALLVSDAGARYPVTIDPLFASAEARLAEETVTGDRLGYSVALDGDTAVVGALDANTSGGTNAGCAYVFVRSGAGWIEQARLTASDGESDDAFGISVALSGDTAVVGADFDDGPGGVDAGSVYVFVRQGTRWIQQANFSAADGAPHDNFGIKVALSGDTALVGADGAQTSGGVGAGAGYVFVRSGTAWTQQAKLSAGDGAAGDAFGFSLALDGDTAAIGAYGSDYAGDLAGSAYVFVRSGTDWHQQQKLVAGDRTANDGFGIGMAVKGDTVLVGAPGHRTGGGEAGGVYVFERTGTTWAQQAELAASDGVQGACFGIEVALSGDTALIGAFRDSYINEKEFGSAYVFVRTGANWSQEVKLNALDRSADANFGTSVSLSGNTALIGATGDDSGGASSAGSAYVFERTSAGWTQHAKLAAGANIVGNDLGSSVALDGETAMVGIDHDDLAAGTDVGSVYVFVRNDDFWSKQARLAAGDGAQGDLFGARVALAGNTALIGAVQGKNGAGAATGTAYIFRRTGLDWLQEAKLTSDDGVAGDGFGLGVAVFANTVVVGAYLHQTPAGVAAGSAYVFTRDSGIWHQQARLAASDGAAGDWFGLSVALQDTTALIGAPRHDPGGAAGAGSVYVYRAHGSSWSEEARLRANDGAAYANLGYSVAIDGETALAGAVVDSTGGGSQAGSAYVFVRSGATWVQQAKLTASDAMARDEFGFSVCLQGDIALIGAIKGDKGLQADVGSAYAFARSGNTWSQQAKLSAGVDSAPGDLFGCAVALSGNTALVGAPSNDLAAENAGGAFVFLLGELPEITRQPRSRTAVPGAAVTFSVTATGYPPLRYQWRKNGIEIPGADQPDYSIGAAALGDAGSYDAVISNAGGTVTSTAAVLGINSLSQFTQLFPGRAPLAQGFVLVNLTPAGIPAAWRFAGEQQWRASGVPVGGLTTGDRSIEFRAVPGYLQPLRESVAVTSGQPATVIDREYYETSDGASGGLSLTLKPDALAAPGLPIAQRAQWRLLGEDDSHWRDSGVSAVDLPPGFYLCECKPLPGHTTPAPISVPVLAGAVKTATATYFLADAPIGTLPGVLPFETVTGSATLPYAFVGQLRSTAGSSSGFVVKSRVVATAGHVVFDDGTLSAAIGLEWLFERDAGTFEPTAQQPRGYYSFDGYATQRTNEGTPGESAPASQNLDVAALYFNESPGRGGFGGYLASDATQNEWLLSEQLKILIGYPVDGIAPANRGRMHATAPLNVRFAPAFGETFTTSDVTSTGGSSGGPLCVRFDDGNYYPAAIYLGGSAQTVVRAIDGTVVDLFERAEVSGNGGANNTGGGITQSMSQIEGNPLRAASLRVTLSPQGAIDAGARWRLGANGSARRDGTQLTSLAPGKYTLFFSPIAGFGSPPPKVLTLSPGDVISVSQRYDANVPPEITSALTARATMGLPFRYQISVTNTAASYEASGLDGTGLSLDATTGLISGIPVVTGPFDLTLSAVNPIGTGTPATLRLIIYPPGFLTVSIRGRGTVTPGFLGTSPRVVAKSYSLVAAPGPGFLFDGWSGGLTYSAARLTFKMPEELELQANFIPNPFLPLKGVFRGLIQATPFAVETAGFAKVTVSASGAFSETLQWGGHAYSLKGKFSHDGSFRGETLRSLGLPSLPVTLHLDFSGSAHPMSGTVGDSALSASFQGARAAFDPVKNPAPRAGRYTFRLPSFSNAVDLPQGTGYGIVSVAPSGAVKLNGVLGDGRSVMYASALSATEEWPLFLAPYGGRSCVTGLVAFHERTASDLEGALQWVKPPVPLDASYPKGFHTQIDLAGSSYLRPKPGDRLLHFAGNGDGEFASGALAEPLVLPVATRSFTVTLSGGSSLHMTFFLESGLFSGKFSESSSASLRKFAGALSQKTASGNGLLTRQGQTSPVEIHSAAPAEVEAP